MCVLLQDTSGSIQYDQFIQFALDFDIVPSLCPLKQLGAVWQLVNASEA